MLFPLLLRERSGDKFLSLRSREIEGQSQPSIWKVLKDLFRAFSRRSPILGAGLALSSQIGLGVITAVSTVLLMQEFGWEQEEYGQRVGGLPSIWQC